MWDKDRSVHRPYRIDGTPSCVRGHCDIVDQIDRDVLIRLLNHKDGPGHVPGLILLGRAQILDARSDEKHVGQVVNLALRQVWQLVDVAMDPQVPAIIGPIAVGAFAILASVYIRPLLAGWHSTHGRFSAWVGSADRAVLEIPSDFSTAEPVGKPFGKFSMPESTKEESLLSIPPARLWT